MHAKRSTLDTCNIIKNVTDWEGFLLCLCSNTPQILQIHITNCKTNCMLWSLPLTHTHTTHTHNTHNTPTHTHTHKHTHTHTHTHTASPLLISVATATLHSPSHLTNSTGALQTFDRHTLIDWSFIHTNTTLLSPHSSVQWSPVRRCRYKPRSQSASVCSDSPPSLPPDYRRLRSDRVCLRRGPAAHWGLGRAGAGCQRGPESILHPEDEEERKYVALHERSGFGSLCSCSAFASVESRPMDYSRSLAAVCVWVRETERGGSLDWKVWVCLRMGERGAEGSKADDDTHAPPLSVFRCVSAVSGLKLCNNSQTPTHYTVSSLRVYHCMHHLMADNWHILKLYIILLVSLQDSAHYSLLTKKKKTHLFCLLTLSKVVVVVFMWSRFILVKLNLTAVYLHQKVKDRFGGMCRFKM